MHRAWWARWIAKMFVASAAALLAAAVGFSLGAVAGCAKPAPPDLVIEAPQSANAASGASPAPTAGGQPPSAPASEPVSTGPRAAFRAYYYRHKDGDRAVYRVVGNMHAKRKMTITYRRRIILMLDEQRASVLEVRRDFGDGETRAVFYLEDEISGTTRALGYAESGTAGITMYDPPPLTLDWTRAAHKGFVLEIPYRPVTMVGEQRVPIGDMKLDKLGVLGTQDIGVRDATGTPVRYRRALKWKLTDSQGGVTTIWWGTVGEAVREDYVLGASHERRELVRVIRR